MSKEGISRADVKKLIDLAYSEGPTLEEKAAIIYKTLSYDDFMAVFEYNCRMDGGRCISKEDREDLLRLHAVYAIYNCIHAFDSYKEADRIERENYIRSLLRTDDTSMKM